MTITPEQRHEIEQDGAVRIEDPETHAAYVILVIEAEVEEFGPTESLRLSALLRDFIRSHRDSNDPVDLIAAGAAIRKLVAILEPGAALEHAAELLDSRARSPVPIDLELEIVKMVVRKLSVHPPEEPDSLPFLTDRLLELVKTYLNPRLLSRDKYPAIALNAALGFLLVRSSRTEELLGRIGALPVAWRRELFSRRASRLAGELRRRFPEDRQAALIQILEEAANRGPTSTGG